MNAHVIAGFKTDLELALGYLRLKKLTSDMAEIHQARGVYVCTVKLKGSFKEVADTLSARYGRFVQLRRP